MNKVKKYKLLKGNKIVIDKKLDGKEFNFRDDFKKICLRRHKWDDGWVCSMCGVKKADWVEANIKTK